MYNKKAWNYGHNNDFFAIYDDKQHENMTWQQQQRGYNNNK